MKKLLLCSMVLVFTIESISQTVNIPDPNFEQALIDLGIDTNVTPDGLLLKSSAESVTYLNVSNKNISSLVGIDAFINLTNLDCYNNILTSLDISSNLLLENLNASFNQLTSINLGNNASLKFLGIWVNKLTTINLSNLPELVSFHCGGNQFVSLDVTNNTKLKEFRCDYNKLRSLDVSQSPVLSYLSCEGNQLISLNIANGNNSNFTPLSWTDRSLDVRFNYALTCIQVDAGILSNIPSHWFKEDSTNYSANCPVINCDDLIAIPDANFEQALIDLGFDTNGLTGNIKKCDAVSIIELNINNKNISSLTGIEHFTGLRYLYCNDNKLTTLNLGNKPNLINMHSGGNALTSIDVSNCPKLVNLSIWANKLTSLDLSQNPDLEELLCSSNNLTSIDISGKLKLRYISFAYNRLVSLNIANGNNANFAHPVWADFSFDARFNPLLSCINVDDGMLGNIPPDWFKDATANYSANCPVINCDDLIAIPDANFEQALIDLGFDTNGLSGNIKKCDAASIIHLDVSNKNISSLSGIEHFVGLWNLYCQHNLLTELNLGVKPNLTNLDAGGNSLTSIDLTTYPKLVTLSIWGNKLSSLNLSQNTNLEDLHCSSNKLTSMDVSTNSKLKVLNFADNKLVNLNIANGNNTNFTKVEWSDFSFDARYNPGLMCIQVDTVMINNIPSHWFKDSSASYSENCTVINCDDLIAIPDANFEQALIDLGFDTNGLTGNIKKCDAASIVHLDVNDKNILSLEGIEYFNGLKYLYCQNNLLSELNLGDNPNLINLHCGGNSLTNIDVSNYPNLVSLHIWLNQLTRLDLSNNPNLEELLCSSNKLTAMDISSNPKLKFMNFADNKLLSLNIANGNNTNFLKPDWLDGPFDARFNHALTCIQVDPDIVNSIPSNWFKDATASYSANCPVINCDDLIAIPDANFEQALIDLGFDTNGKNGNIKKCDALSVTNLNVNEKNISSLSGIEHFTNLQYLYCNNNLLTILNLGDKPNLINLDCGRNALTSIDVSNYPKLINLDIWNNQLLSLDVSQNLHLEALIIFTNKLTSLDISVNSKLKFMNFANNKLVNLNIANGNNINFLRPEWATYSFDARNNPTLSCIKVDANIINNIPTDWFKDASAIYNTSCENTNCDNIITANVKVFPGPFNTGDIKSGMTFGGSGFDRPNTFQQGMVATTDGGYIFTGRTSSTDGDLQGIKADITTDILVVKLDCSFNIQWKKIFGGTGFDEGYAVIQANDGGYMIAGSTSSSVSGDVSTSFRGSDAWLIKLDANGNKQWEKSYGGSNHESFTGVAQTLSGDYIVVGNTDSTDGDLVATISKGGQDMWVVKVNSIGTILNQRRIGGIGSLDVSSHIVRTTDGNYLLTGYTNSADGDITLNKGDRDGYLDKMDENLNKLWAKTYGGTGGELFMMTKPTNDGGYISTGLVTSSEDGDITGKGNGSFDVWIVKLAADGSIQWERNYGGPNSEQGQSIDLAEDGGYVVGGLSSIDGGDVAGFKGTFDSWILRLDSSGNLLWQKPYGGSGNESMAVLLKNAAGELITLSRTNSSDGDLSTFNNNGNFDFWITRVADCTSFITATVTASRALNTLAPVVLTANTGAGFSYQWYRNNAKIIGETNDTYTATAIGSYKVAISAPGLCAGYSSELNIVEKITKFYVNDNNLIGDVFTTSVGSNANTGTKSLPFASLEYALSMVQSNDTIYVDAGTYITPNLTIDKSVTILGANALINPNDPVNPLLPSLARNIESTISGSTLTIGAPNIIIEGLSLTSGSKSAISMSNKDWSDFEVKNSIFNIASTANNIMTINISGTVTLPLQANNYKFTDNRFVKTDGFNGANINLASIKNVIITGNSMVVTGAISRTQSGIILGTTNGGITTGTVDNATINKNYIENTVSAIIIPKLSNAIINENTLINGSGSGIQCFYGLSEISNLNINNNKITDFLGLGIVFRGTINNGLVKNILIENNILNKDVGILTALNQDLPENMISVDFRISSSIHGSAIIRNNKINITGDFGTALTSSANGIHISGQHSLCIIDGNELNYLATGYKLSTRNNPPVPTGIVVSTDWGSSYGNIPSTAIINIRNNSINGYGNSIAVYDRFTTGGATTVLGYGYLTQGATVNINNNSFTGDVMSINNGTTGQRVYATCNWYGDAAIQNILNKVTLLTGYYVPFLTNGTDSDSSSIGFQPVPNSCNGWPLLASVTSKTDVSCFGANNGSINLTIDNLFKGKAPYTYLWTKDDEPEFTSTVEDPNNLSPGTYRVTITDDWGTNILVDYDGNIKTIEVDINEPEVLTATASIINNLCFEGTTGSIIVTAFGGTAPYTYLWSNGGTEDQISNLAAGIYSVLVTDANGCESNTQYEVTQPTQITLQLIDISTACSNIATVSAQGGTGSYTYLWSNGATSATISGVAVGTYTVLVTDANGCSKSGNIVLAVKEAFNPSASTINVSCNGGSDGSISIGNVNGQAPFSYSIDGINYIQGQNVFSNLRAGTYTVGVKDANGCTGFVTKTISEPLTIAIVIDNIQGTCSGVNTGSISISTSGGSPGYSYSWTGLNGYTSSSKNISNLATGTYSIKVTDSKGCSKTFGGIVVPTTNAIVVTQTVTHIACKGETNGSIILNVSGGSGNGFNYSWSTGSNTNAINNLNVGNYNVTITDNGTGCAVTKSYSITQPSTNVSISVAKVNATGCNSMGKITITASGGTGPNYSYKLDSGEYGPNNVFTNLQAGTYVAWVKDSKDCVNSQTVIITDNGSDEFEGNNSKNQAKPINIGTAILARIGSATDVDWFRFVVPTSGGNYTLNVQHSVAIYTFNLYSSSNNSPILIPVNQTSTSKNYNLLAGTYFIQITGNQSFICYNLAVNLVTNSSARLISSKTEYEIINEQGKKDEIEISKFDVIAYPNPSTDYFLLKMIGSSLDVNLNVNVFDALGRLVYSKSGNFNDEYRFGEQFQSGVYLVNIQQGTEKVILRVIKH